ncbi:MAG: hypothetical protein IPO10_01755 [Flavobacteriales bacterium]|nr:hypothetical protein [Flavobacteriales bacterium]
MFVLLYANAYSQHVGNRNVVLEEITIPNMPGIHSFAWGQHNGEWLVIGGRTDGLHQRQPFAAFLASANNTMAYVLNPVTNEVWSADLSSLPTALFEQLQSTNLEFHQRGNTLYIIGGYGFSPTANDHITHSQACRRGRTKCDQRDQERKLTERIFPTNDRRSNGRYGRLLGVP